MRKMISVVFMFSSACACVLHADEYYTDVKDGAVLTGEYSKSIRISDNATITLRNAHIANCRTSSGIVCQGNATIILADDTTNTVDPWCSNCPGILVGPAGTTLTIKGESKGNGKLTTSGRSSPGIGGESRTPCGNIVIMGGNITTTGDTYTPGIGSGYNSSCGNITITGGKVTATGGYRAAGICAGGSASCMCGNITISGGEVTATGGTSAKDIGTGMSYSQCGNISIEDTITKVVGNLGSAEGTTSCGTITIGAHLKQETDSNGVLVLVPMSYAIKFNANGGSGGKTVTLEYGATLGSLPEPTRYDFDFGGWWTASIGGSVISSSTKVTGAATYYAHWIDPIPELTGMVTDEMVSEALSGSADDRITSKIITPSSYNEYRQWINNKGLSHKAAKASPNAWLSYALDAPGLMAKATALASEDVVIESIAPSSAAGGAFDLVVNIADAEIGKGARLAEVLGVEGATELNESAFSSEGLTVTLERTADGKAKATVAPDGAPPAFFLRVKVK